MRPLASLLLALPLVLAGCLGATDGTPEDAAGTGEDTSLNQRGALAGPVDLPTGGADGSAENKLYPYHLAGAKLKPPVHLEIPGKFESQDCTPVGGTGNSWQQHDLSQHFTPGDAFQIRASLVFENTDDAWGDIHLFMGLPGGFSGDTSFYADKRGPIEQVIETQNAWPGREADNAFVAVGCWYGLMTRPIEYTITVHIQYAEDVVPYGIPILFEVPAGATKLFATGVPLEEGKTVTSHYRIFRPDDTELGGFALNSNEAIDEAPLEGPGAYVILVDHTENGFLRIGTDAPPATADLVPLSSRFERVAHFSVDGEQGVSKTAEFELKSVPLGIWAWVEPKDGTPAQGHGVVIDIENAVGRVLHISIGNFVDLAPNGQSFFIGLPSPTGEWAFESDHHAYVVGPHKITLKADTLRGTVAHYVRLYERPGATLAEASTATGSALAPPLPFAPTLAFN